MKKSVNYTVIRIFWWTFGMPIDAYATGQNNEISSSTMGIYWYSIFKLLPIKNLITKSHELWTKWKK